MAAAPAEHHEEVTDFNVVATNQQGITRTMIFFASWIALAAWIANFDNGYTGVVLIMPSYQKAFGTCAMVVDPGTAQPVQVCSLSATQQSLVSVPGIFMGLGGVLSGLSGHYLGRRGTVLFSSILTVVGAAGMLGTSGSFLNYMACRCISAVGLGQVMAATSIYGAESIAANKRGLLLGLYNIGLAMGNVVASAVCAGSATLSPTNDWQWKAPIIIQIPLGLLLGIGIYMFPESPRWLLVKGREADARRSFGRLYGKDPNSDEITAQVHDVQNHIELEKALGSTVSWTEIFHRADIRRTSVSAFIMIGLGLSGIQFVAPYAALFLNGLGVSSPYLINVIIGLSILAGSSIGSWAVEYGGRRFSLLVGYSAMACCMLIFSAVGSALGPSNPVSQKVLIAFLCIWAFVFGGFIGPSVWLASAEMHSIRLRTYGQANTTLLYAIVSFAATFWTPYMLNTKYGNMGTNMGYFHFGLTLVLVILTFLFVPETARLTLEQIDDYFTSGRKPWHTSTKRNKRIAQGQESDVVVHVDGDSVLKSDSDIVKN